ncbi:MAG: TIGR03767 family metallophosphoesterase [Actinomycetota bacterium]|nr:TIGR03767 family metallophosphoesterase [Actinomycetota bacterium]
MAAPTTLERTLAAAGVARVGTEQSYMRLGFSAGEARTVRGAPTPGGALVPRPRRSLLLLVQLTDLQLADTASPGRFEFFEYLRGLPGTSAFIPAHRPQEALAFHAVDAMARAIRTCGGSPDTGAPIGLALCTGDNIDNAQLNELTWFLSLIAGGRVELAGTGGHYEGVQSAMWPSDLYWHPDGGADRYRDRWGFPDYPGLLDQATASFDAGGAGVPWLSCFGNHEGLAFGESVPTAEYRQILTGALKPTALGPGCDPLHREEELFAHPERFLTGPALPVTPDATRTIVTRRDFVAAHLRAAGLPTGHGYSEENLENGTCYAAYDGIEGIRLILLDSTNLNGRSGGSFGLRQLAWLEERLAEVHARHMSRSGSTTVTGNEDRLVVLASHHGLASLSNDRETVEGPEEDQPRATAVEVEALLHRFPNVVLWLNGHRHLNEIRFRRAPGTKERGFWEVSTVSLADWPSQARLVELTANGDGSLSVLCTMLDHLGPADPREADGPGRIASIHRELAANAPGHGLSSSARGRLEDRNVELVMRAPFQLQ